MKKRTIHGIEIRDRQKPAPAHLVELVQRIVAESAERMAVRGFDARAWLEEWLSLPNRALGGVCPSTYLGTQEGHEMLATLIARMQSSAYS
jgi:uncharacterized protein (DUF2384 family)